MTRVFERPGGVRLALTGQALAAMDSYRQVEKKDLEGGGVLLGRLLVEGEYPVVDEVTTPQDKDKRTRTSFYRSEQHCRIAENRWKESGGRIGHLGLWHTHPEQVPTPSKVDLKDWKNAVLNDRYGSECLFFIIVGIERLRIWCNDGEKDFLELKEIT